jgi:hypothetical protein
VSDTEDFLITQGDSFIHEFTWVHEGAPQDLTGLTGTAQIRVRHNSSTTLASFTVTPVDAEAGIFTVGLSDSQTRALPVGHESCVYDVQFTGGSFGTITPVTGAITVQRDVTR